MIIVRPTLILDKIKCLRNMQAMAEKAKKSGVKLTPHFKTHQSTIIGSWYKAYGIDAITVSSMACPVVELHPERNEVVIHGGGVQFSKDFIVQKDGSRCYGKCIGHWRDVWDDVIADVYLKSLSQEHGILHAPSSFFDNIQIGDILGFLPVHACLTADAMQGFKTLDGEDIAMMPKAATDISLQPENNIKSFVQRLSILFFAIMCLAYPVLGQNPNYDETKVGSYVLPNPLIDLSGKNVTTKQMWQKARRSEILDLFKANVYGKFPMATKGIHFKVTSVNTNALNGRATRKEITIYFTSEPDSPSMDVLLYLPNQVTQPVPVFIGLNFYGNHSTQSDSEIKLSERWMRSNEAYQIKENRSTEGSRGLQQSRWPVDSIIAQGYGVATAYYGDLEPDHAEGWKTGIRTTLQNELNTKSEEWGAIGAWAWGLSRIMDYLQTDKRIKANQVIVTGHSRLAKAALWSAANDQRFAMVIANCAGEGGTALARRNFGETIAIINTNFPYWFSPDFKNFNGAADKLPVDQHMLLSLIAPRPLYVASAEDDRWADPKGEFLSLVNAAPVYSLFNKNGIVASDIPEVNMPIVRDVGYKMRQGKHDITLEDWAAFIQFSEMHFTRKK